MKPEDMVLRHNEDVPRGYWTPEGLKFAYAKRDVVFLKQRFIQSDYEFYSIGVPILDKNNNITMATAQRLINTYCKETPDAAGTGEEKTPLES